VHWNPRKKPQLYQYSLAAGEAVLGDALGARTPASFTGRSPKTSSLFAMRHRQEHVVGWQPVDHPDQFSALYADFSSTPKA
jgi:hypothetical protein